MNKIEYERTKVKLDVFKERGFYWVLNDINKVVSIHQYKQIQNIAKRLKNEYEEQICNYKAESKFLKQIEIKFKNNEY